MILLVSLLSVLFQFANGQLLVNGIPNTLNTLDNLVCPLGPFALSIWFRSRIPRKCILTPTGNKRCYYTYIPRCAGKDSPLLYDIHAFGYCPLINAIYEGWKKLADEKCMVVMWPMGNFDRSVAGDPCFALPADLSGGFADDPDRETTPCCCYNPVDPTIPVTEDETQDLAFLRSIASHVVLDVPKRTRGRVTINTKRIYMAGHSNGCVASLSMAMKHSDLVAAVCCHSGILISEPSDDYIPTPIWFVHGILDDTIPYYGGENPGAQDAYDYLFSRNGCQNTTLTLLLEEGDSQLANGCTNNASVELVSLVGAGHQPYPIFGQTTYETTLAAWEFCSSYESLIEPVLDVV